MKGGADRAVSGWHTASGANKCFGWGWLSPVQPLTLHGSSPCYIYVLYARSLPISRAFFLILLALSDQLLVNSFGTNQRIVSFNDKKL